MVMSLYLRGICLIWSFDLATEVSLNKSVVRVINKHAVCPVCCLNAQRHSLGEKKLKHIKGTLMLHYSKHYCTSCRKHFVNPCIVTYCPKHVRSTWSFIRYSVEQTLKYSLDEAAKHIFRKTGNRLAIATLHDWVVRWDELRKEAPFGFSTDLEERNE